MKIRTWFNASVLLSLAVFIIGAISTALYLATRADELVRAVGMPSLGQAIYYVVAGISLVSVGAAMRVVTRSGRQLRRG